MLLGRTENLHDAGKLLLLILAWEDGNTCIKLGQDATHAPHIDGHTISHAEYDLR
jgi:hypothetical protein